MNVELQAAAVEVLASHKVASIVGRLSHVISCLMCTGSLLNSLTEELLSEKLSMCNAMTNLMDHLDFFQTKHDIDTK